MATDTQTEANHLNAQTSTGPAADYKAPSLDALAPAQVEAVEARRASWVATFAPRNEAEVWLVDQLVIESVRIDACQAEAAAQARHDRLRASLCWDDDRRAEVEEIGRRLAKDPERVARRLERTRHGCDWLLEHWDRLAEVLAQGRAWSDSEMATAFDLLGVDPEIRDGQVPWALCPEKGASGLVLRERERLRRRKSEGLDALDADAREAAAAGTPVSAGGTGVHRARNRIRRDEAACWRRFHDARRELEQAREAGPATPAELSPQPSPLPIPPRERVDPKVYESYEAAIVLAALERLARDTAGDDGSGPSAAAGRISETPVAADPPAPLSIRMGSAEDRPASGSVVSRPPALPRGNRRLRRAAARRARRGVSN